MKLLFIGDIVGSPGRRAVRELVPKLREQHALDFVIANGENSAGGSGITPRIAEELFAAGVDAITTGDHLWDQKEVIELLQSEKRFLRPINYPAGTPGHGSTVLEWKNGNLGRAAHETAGNSAVEPSSHDLNPALIAVVNVQGRTFMANLENPFHAMRAEIARLRQQTSIIFVDVHAEATSEKIALARMLDGQVSAVIGTHTHVQTADEQIFSGGTAYLTDAGFTGPHESVIGREIQPVVQRFLTNMPQRFEVAKERVLLQGAMVEIDESTGKALAIQRVSERVA